MLRLRVAVTCCDYVSRLRIVIMSYGYVLWLRVYGYSVTVTGVTVTCLRLLGNGYWGVGCVFEVSLVGCCYW